MKVFIYYQDNGWDGDTTIIIAANSKEEIMTLFKDYYPFKEELLFECPQLTANVDEPQVIDDYMDVIQNWY